MIRAERRSARAGSRKQARKAKQLPLASPAPAKLTAIQHAGSVALQHHAAGRLPQAKKICQQILLADPNQVFALNLLSYIAYQEGRVGVAIDLINKVLAIKPNFAEARNNLGNVLQNLGKLDEAVASYRKALAIDPRSAQTHCNLGNALKKLGRLNEAIFSYRKALALKPDLAETHDVLCDLLEKSNRIDALREAVRVAQRNCPGDPRITLREAQLLKRNGDYSGARMVLEAIGKGIPDARFRAMFSHLRGEVYDRLGDVDTAFDCFREGNRQCSEIPEAKLHDGKRFLAQIDVLSKRFSSDWVGGWQELEVLNDRPDPVFMVGFLRSGTTLLDTILRSHRAISVVSERPTLISLRRALGQLAGGYPHCLAEINSAQLTELRQIYFAELDKYLAPEGLSAIVVDNAPLNTIDVGLIHRIFPSARFLFARRHPCDCVLSSYMQLFRINDAMANFLDLADSANLYDKVMTLWQQYMTVLPLAVHTVRYESLIEAFTETLTPVFDFLGVGWDDGVLDYAATAYRRGKISTPSYNQVIQPLYMRSRGRWERYRGQMQEVLPTLLPWAKRFGYNE